MRLAYESWDPPERIRKHIAQAIQICQLYADQGYDLTLRQLYYQYVARDLIENTLQSYKRLGDWLNKARLAGMLDWDFIVDRTRNLRSVPHWIDPEDIIRGAADQFRVDKWAGQPYRVETWVEKEALAGVVQRVADLNDVAWFSCRGYPSQSEVWSAARRILRYIEGGQGVIVLHLGDHDPSGIDMTRDITDRIEQFLDHDWLRDHGHEFMTPEEIDENRVTIGRIRDAMRATAGGVRPFEVRRIALNMDQIEEYDPPPNPAKFTDSRINGYVRDYGYESWELDALPPDVLDALIQRHIDGIRVDNIYVPHERREARDRELLTAVHENWSDVVDLVG